MSPEAGGCEPGHAGPGNRREAHLARPGPHGLVEPMGIRELGQPATISRYEIQEEIGRGMMGVVYGALDPALGRTVALKTVQLAARGARRGRAGFEQRFLAEARIAAGLNHPASWWSTTWAATRQRQPVHRARVPGGRDPVRAGEARRLAWCGARPCASARGWRRPCTTPTQQGIVHRDVKPANIMVLPHGQPKLMDFGIAKIPAVAAHQRRRVLRHAALHVAGAGRRPSRSTRRSDVFSLGAVLYLLLTGRARLRRAFGAGHPGPRGHQDPSPPSKLTPELPAVVDDIVARALAKDSAQRYATAHMLAEDIQDVLAERTPRHRATWTAPALPADGIGDGRGHGRPARVPAFRARPRPHDRGQRGPGPDADGGAAASDRARLRRAASRTRPLRTWPPMRFAPASRGARGRSAAGIDAGRRLGPGRDLRHGVLGAPDRLRLRGAGGFESGPGRRRCRRARSPAARSSRARAPGCPSRSIQSLKQGRLRLWVDGTLRLEKRVGKGTAARVALFVPQGDSPRGAIDVAPGVHDVKVEVAWDDNVRTQRVRATFRPGDRRVLAARLRGFFRTSLSLRWQ